MRWSPKVGQDRPQAAKRDEGVASPTHSLPNRVILRIRNADQHPFIREILPRPNKHSRIALPAGWR
jgi:hypothetical protein